MDEQDKGSSSAIKNMVRLPLKDWKMETLDKYDRLDQIGQGTFG